MKKKLIVGALSLTTIIGFMGSYTNNKKAENLQNNILNQQAVLAVLWQQESAEVKALRLQAYNQAKENVDQLIAANKLPCNAAVVLDLDETVMDNIPAGAYQITSNNGYNHNDFTEWTGKAECKEIEGASDFINYAQSKGIEVFFVSNRSQEEMAATMENLKNLNIEVSESNIFLKEKTSGKGERFDKIKASHEIIMYIGDNAGDFGGEYYKKTNEERSQLVLNAKDEMGVKYIALPNPTYGDFDGAMYGYDFKKSDAEKIKIKNELLKPFK
ncbi:5'-nucleotidase, lipoprotein e(P4) family [Cetobacterium sp.]|uniref:5'-nucleotidase, lipoprotein e(P4) family n=1 Tax=Cetobacterium sp. TaxID=2071632 RepID=UPI003EE7A4D2